MHLLFVQKTWRLIDTDLAHPYYVTAADDAISIARSKDKVPNTLHFYRRSPPGVSLGRFQSVKDVDLTECKNRGIAVVRRRTGGGTIFTDEGCLIYALIFKSGLVNPNSVFLKVCGSIVSALRNLGFDAMYKDPNDVLINGRKVSGSALVIRGDTILIHGTVIVSSDIELMKKILLKKREIEVTSLKKEKEDISMEDVKSSLIREFGRTLDAKFERSKLTDYERILIEDLIEERYGKDDWNLGR